MAARKKSKRSSKDVRYAVVGMGHIVQVAVLPAFKKKNIKSKLVALVSGTPAKLKKLSKTYKVDATYSYDEYDSMLESGTIDAVYIGLPNSMHHDFAMRALKRGIHVLCEKPLCPTVKECKELVAAAKKHRAKLMTAYRLHFEPCNLHVIDLIKKGKIGEPKLFTSLFSFQINSNNHRLEVDMGSGALSDIGVYCINAARYIFRAEPHTVMGTMIKGQDRRFKEVDGTTSGTLLFGKDQTAIFSCSFATHDRSMYEIVGTRGSIRVEPAFDYREQLEFELITESGTKKYRYKKHDQFAAQIAYFSNAVLNDSSLETDGEEGLADVRIMQALELSSKRGRAVTLKELETDYPSQRMKRAFPFITRKPILIGVQGASS